MQLEATVLDGSGAPLAGRPTAWTTSDTAIALVSSTGLVTTVGAGRVTITASSDGKAGTSVLDVRAGGAIGAEGGVLLMLGGRAVLIVPRDAVTQSTTLLLAPSTAGASASRLVPGTAFELAPEGLTFAWTPTLNLKYDAARIPAGVPASSLRLHLLVDGVWTQMRGGGVDTTTRLVYAPITRTGVYAVVGIAVDRVTLTGGLVGGALVVGQSARLGAATFDALGTSLVGRAVTWQSSDPSVATVGADGTVTAVGAGSVTVTATSEGRSAATTLAILPRPTPDWREAVEWTTYQGNARRTGFVPVTADPAAFRELWVSTPFGALALSPVTTAAGQVFVSTGAYSGTSVKWTGAVDARTGVVQWSRDFGAIHGANPPAYADGTVYLSTSGLNFLWALDAATGAERFRSPYRNQRSAYFAPAIVGGVVYVGGGEFDGVYAFGAADGVERWFRSTLQIDRWTPAVDEGVVYLYPSASPPKVSALNAATGQVLFEIRDPGYDGPFPGLNLAPALGGSNDLLVTNNGRLLSFDLQRRVIGWTQSGEYTGTVAVGGGAVYAVNGTQVDVRRQSDGSLIGSWTPPEGQVRAPVLVTRNLLFASTAAATYAVDLATRRHVWSYPGGGALALNANGVLFIAQANGRLAAITLR
ncbi:hypothetical protein rosag_20450 [Roseisolibacter agri]|uniref:BIG2 domain-containing protein n=1 Tax=Roseisolibacter agri TaxID=2014610 RepID=A0AA37Q882_9BACT|nr:hypothetical protein rosag_20450 [Roseisolibacter agri]